MENKKILTMLDELRTELNMLMENYYDSSDDGISGMKSKINTALYNLGILEDKVKNLETLTSKVDENTNNISKNAADIQDILAFIEINIMPILDGGNDIDNLKNYIKRILNSFLTEEEITNLSDDELYNLDIMQKINYLSPIFKNIRETCENGGTGSGEDYSQEISDIQSQLALLNLKINAVETPNDPYYVGKSFSDYPAGTILQTYDYDERPFNKSSNTSITSNKMHFTTEVGATGTINVIHKLLLTQKVGSVIIKTFLNGSQLDKQTFEITQVNTEQTLEYNIYDVNFNAETKANIIYFTFAYVGTGNYITQKYQKVAITAPNICFLDKICPFDAYYFNNKYYLTDCSSGIIKTAEINADEIRNISNVTWIDTGIPAQECITCGSYTKCSDSSYIPNKFYYLKRDLNGEYYVGQIENSISDCKIKYMTELDYVTQYDQNVCFVGKYVKEKETTYKSSYNPTNNTYSDNRGKDYEESCIKLTGVRYNSNQLQNGNIAAMNIRHATDGTCRLNYSHTNYIVSKELNSGSSSTLVITEYKEQTVYRVNAYIKYFDKILKYDINYDNTNRYVINSVIEFGYYDKVFEMPNNDYFVIKNNQLMYFKNKTE